MAMLPKKIGGYRSSVINALIQYLQDGVIVESSDHRIEKTSGGLVLHNIEKPADVVDFPFRISTGGVSIRVRQGSVTRNDSRLTLAVDSGKDWKTLTTDKDGGAFTANTTYIVYVALERNDNQYHPGLAPDQISVYAVDSVTGIPSGSPVTANEYIRLGTIATDANTKFKQPVQEWWGGDIDDVVYVPDSNNPYDAAASSPYTTPAEYRFNSLELSPRANRHFRDLQIYNWDSPNVVTLATDDYFMFQDTSDNNKSLQYITAQGFLDWIEENLDLSDSVNGGGIGDWLHESSNWKNYHTNDNFTDIGDGWAALGTGKSGGNTDHDDSYWHAYNDGSAIGGHDAFIDTKDYRTTGDVWAAELHLSADGSTDSQYWTAAAFLANVTGAFNLTAGATSDWNITGALTLDTTTNMDLTSSGGSVGINADGNINLVVTGAGNVSLGSTGGGAVLYLGSVGGGLFSSIEYNGNTGLDTYGDTKGGFTDQSAFEAGIETIATDIVELYL